MSTKHRMLFLRIILLIFVFVFFLPAATSFAQTLYSNTKFDAMSYMLIEMDSGKVLAQHDADRRVYPASTTKLMTALLLLEKKGLEGTTTVGTEINGLPNGSSLMHIQVGEKVPIKDLFYGLMLCSGNDAANTIAVYVSGSVDNFVALMNQRAAELGMSGTRFVTPYGAFFNQDQANSVPQNLLGVNHYTTVSDMAKLTLAAAKYPEILKAGNTGSYMLSATNKHDEERKIENSNPLVHTPEKNPELAQFYYKDATGLKTGTVNNIVLGDKTIRSYGNVVATAKRNGLSLAALIFDDQSEKSLEGSNLYSYQRWQLAADLFDFGFENYTWVDLKPYIPALSMTRPVAVDETGKEQPGLFEISSKSDTPPEKALLESTVSQALKNGTASVEKEVTIDDVLQSSVQLGDTVGTVKYTLNGTEVYETDLVVTGKTQPQPDQSQQPTRTGNVGNQAGQKMNIFGLQIELPDWYLWALIPACVVAALFAIRAVNLYRRARRRRRRGIRKSRYRRGL